MKKIKLTKGKYAIVDDEDYEMVSQFNWSANKSKNGQYRAMKNKSVKSGQIYMHRLIMNVTDSKIWVDHKDRNQLNNRKSNLRLCNAAESARNVVRKKTTNSSMYRGVYFSNREQKQKNKNGEVKVYVARLPVWRALVAINGKTIFLGWFKDERKAAVAYNEAAKKYHGEFAVLNKV